MKKIFTLLMLTGSIAFAAVMSTAPETVVREYDFNAVEKIRVENTSGRITITPMERPKIVITMVKKKFSERCTVQTEKSEFSEVEVRIEKPIGEECEVDVSITAPPEVALNLWSGSGSVDVTGMKGELAFNVGSGSVKADGAFKKIDGKSGSGNVDINGVAGGGNISVGTGTVNLRILENVAGKLDVKTGSGDATLTFPKDSKVNAQLATGSGDVTNDIATSDSAEYGVSVKTGSGDVKVKAY